MADGNLHPPLPEHIVKAVEKLCLAFCPGQIGAVRRGKVGEEPLCFYAGQGGNAGALVCRRQPVAWKPMRLMPVSRAK